MNLGSAAGEMTAGERTGGSQTRGTPIRRVAGGLRRVTDIEASADQFALALRAANQMSLPT
jgi:hypothetical protein